MPIKGGVKSVNLQFNTVGQRDNDMIVPPSDGPMIICELSSARTIEITSRFVMSKYVSVYS